MKIHTDKKTIDLKNWVAQKIIGVSSAMVGFLIGKYFGIAFMALAFLFFMAIYIGIKFPVWYMEKEKNNHGLISCIAWSNVLSWLLPPLGLLTGISSICFSGYMAKGKYRTLGFLGATLALLNAIVGIMLRV